MFTNANISFLIAIIYPLKTGYFYYNLKNHVKRGVAVGPHCCLFVRWEQKTILLYEKELPDTNSAFFPDV